MVFTKKIAYVTLGIVVSAAVVVAIVLAVVLTGNDEDTTNPEVTTIPEVATNPEVTISQGTLRGVNLVTRYNRNIFSFKGIPFAEPPVGDLRFKAPVAPSPWSGILDASSDTSDCSQARGTQVSGSEDCLYLNVFTPRLPTSEDTTLLPVMVFIYGGGFRSGSNTAQNYGPEYLLDKDVVLVVPSYRLGMLGFLSTGDEVAPGNYGLKDLVRALEWNRDNIKSFGGDFNQTTVFGQSAGGIIAHLLALSDSTDGLVQRYIAQSGTALSYDGHRPKEVLADRAIRVGEHLGCPTDTSTVLVECLRGLNTSELLVNTDSIFVVWSNYPNVIWSPTIEPDIEGAFLTEKPADLIEAGKIRDLEFFTSVNRDEGIGHSANYYANPDQFDDFLNNIDIALPAWLTYDTRVQNVTAYTDALKSYYLNDFTADRNLLLRNFTQLLGDALCGYPSYSALQKQLAHLEKPQFLGSFEYRGTLSHSRYVPADDETEDDHVCHGDEMIYFFPLSNSFGNSGAERSEADWQMVETMVQLWTSFSISGTLMTTISGNTVTWEEYSTRNNYLRIGNYSDVSIGAQDDFAGDRMRFWDELTAAATWL